MWHCDQMLMATRRGTSEGLELDRASESGDKRLGTEFNVIRQRVSHCRITEGALRQLQEPRKACMSEGSFTKPRSWLLGIPGSTDRASAGLYEGWDWEASGQEPLHGVSEWPEGKGK